MKYVPDSRKVSLFEEMDSMSMTMTFVAQSIGVNVQRLRIAKMDGRKLDLETYDKIYKLIQLNKSIAHAGS